MTKSSSSDFSSADSEIASLSRRLPAWFRINLALQEGYRNVQHQIKKQRLHTVCQSARCPNRNECWNSGTATFLILGNLCTRGCRFCNVSKGAPSLPELDEPLRVAHAVSSLNLRYVVITSVTRDDLSDGGATTFAQTINAIRIKSPGCRVEVLIPDFQGSESALGIVLAASPDILNHNIETVPRLYSTVRPQADYRRSLDLLQKATIWGTTTKSGIMLGLGESIAEIRNVMRDLRRSGCDILTLGQYLQPNRSLHPVVRFYSPEVFASLREEALSLGFRRVVSGPLVRSSYHAAQNAPAVCV